MKNEPMSLSHHALTRLVQQKSGRNYLKILPKLITPKLADDAYNMLLSLDGRFKSHMMEMNIAHKDPSKDDDVRKTRLRLIRSNCMLFVDFEYRTPPEWVEFFDRVPIEFSYIRDKDKREKMASQIKQLVNERPLLAIQTSPDLFEYIENVTIELCIEFARTSDKWSPTLNMYKKIRSVVNQSAESQLEAIVGGLTDENIIPPRGFSEGTRINCLYDAFKSKECIYEWVKRERYLSSLPGEFNCDEVLFEVLRLGNEEVFRYWKGKRTEAWYLKCLDINPRLIIYIEAHKSKQTIAMRDLVLSHSLDHFPKIALNLHSEEVCWLAIRHKIRFISDINVCTPDMVRYVVDRLCDDTTIDHISLLGGIVMGGLVKKIKTDTDLQWYAIKKFCECANETLLISFVREAVKWLDNSIIEHVLNTCSNYVIFNCFLTISRRLTESERTSLVLRYPFLIRFCERGEIPVSEEMSVLALEINIKYFEYCKKTPKTLEIACRKKYDITKGLSTEQERSVIDLMFSSPNLFQYTCQYADTFISHGVSLDFKKCSIILTSVDNDNVVLLREILGKLRAYDDFWLLYRCFSIACFSATKKSDLANLRADWQQNVVALGDVTDFNAEAAFLLVSFLDYNEHVALLNDGMNGKSPDYKSDSSSDTDEDADWFL